MAMACVHTRAPCSIASRQPFARPAAVQHTPVCQARQWRGCRRLVPCQAAEHEEAASTGAADGEASSSAAASPLTGKLPICSDPAVPEETHYEGNGAAAELIVSLVLGLTLIYAPLTMASIGRRLWIKYKFTNKRLSVVNSSPLFKSQTDIAYSKIKEIRTVPRGFGTWGDMVVFLNDGSRLEMVGLERAAELRRYMESCMTDSA